MNPPVRHYDFDANGAIDVDGIVSMVSRWSQPAENLNGEGVITVVDVQRAVRWSRMAYAQRKVRLADQFRFRRRKVLEVFD